VWLCVVVCMCVLGVCGCVCVCVVVCKCGCVWVWLCVGVCGGVWLCVVVERTNTPCCFTVTMFISVHLTGYRAVAIECVVFVRVLVG
jgi:hypothetical protein